MGKEELKKKIVEIIIDAIWKDAEADYDSTDETEACTIADALIAAGYGDVKELKVELRNKVDYIHEQDEIIKEYKRRALVAEKALEILKTSIPTMVSYAIQGAEKELLEESKDD